MGIRLELDPIKVMKKKFDARFRAAQRQLDQDVLDDSAPYVPRRTGKLAASGRRSGKGRVTWSARYAVYQYYGRSYSHKGNPQASAQWFEKAKAVSKDEWLKSAKRTIRGG